MEGITIVGDTLAERVRCARKCVERGILSPAQGEYAEMYLCVEQAKRKTRKTRNRAKLRWKAAKEIARLYVRGGGEELIAPLIGAVMERCASPAELAKFKRTA